MPGPSLTLRRNKGAALSHEEMDANLEALALYPYSKSETDSALKALRADILKQVFSESPDGYEPIANLYFGPSGSDANTGLSNDTEEQLRTLGEAFRRLTRMFFPVAPFGLNPAPGTYEGAKLFRSVPQFVRISGDRDLPTNHVFVGTLDQPALDVENVNLEVIGCTFRGQYFLQSGPGARVILRNCVFDGPFDYGLVADGGQIIVKENCVFRENLGSGIGLFARNQGAIYLEDPLMLQGTCQIDTFASVEHTSFLRAASTISGHTNHGRRFVVRTNSLISTSGRGLNYFPGTAPGIIETASGGIYE